MKFFTAKNFISFQRKPVKTLNYALTGQQVRLPFKFYQ